MGLLLSASLGGCGARRAVAPAPPTARLAGEAPEPVYLDPLKILAGSDRLTGLSAYDGDDLFSMAYEAYDKEEFELSGALYAKLAAEFPRHSDVPSALWNASLAWEKAGRVEEAIGSIAEYTARVQQEAPLSAAQARIRKAVLLQRLDRFIESEGALKLAGTAEGLEIQEEWELRTLVALVQGARGEFSVAEGELNRLRREIRRHSLREQERFPYAAAMVWYAAGRLYRLRAASVSLADVDNLELLDANLGEKARLLLESRQLFRRCLLHQVPEWSGPAALSLGSVYEDFRRDLLEAPSPSDLDPETARVYEELLVERTRRFLEAAAADYREVLRQAPGLYLEEAWVLIISDALARCEGGLSEGLEGGGSVPDNRSELPDG